MGTRRERVILDLEDHLSTGMARAAAATALLDKQLDSLSRRSVATSRASSSISRDIDGVGRSSRDADTSINQLTGRLRVLGEVMAILGPATVPIGAVAIPAVTGLAAQLGFAAVAGGVLMGSMRGLGGALEAMNKADLEPTTENLAKAEDALNALAPAVREFAHHVRDLAPHLKAIRDIGGESLVPGLTRTLDDVERLGPKVARIFDTVGEAMGNIAADSAESLASDRWADFFEFIATDAPQALSELARTTGNLTHGLGEMWQAFDPLNDDFSSWLLRGSRDFDRWATGLDQTEGFEEFVSYIRENGPQVADTMSAIGNAVLQIVQASAPLGGPVLKALEASANAIAAIADSDLGTPIMAGVAALSLLNRTLAVTASLSKVSLSTGMFAGLGTASAGVKKGAGSIRSDISAMSDTMVAFGANTERAGQAADRMKGRLAGLGKGAALMGGLAVASTGAADGIGLTNTASLALMGSLGGPAGVAIGAGVGALIDLKAASEGARAGLDGLNAAARTGDMEILTAQIEKARKEMEDQDSITGVGDFFSDAVRATRWSDGMTLVEKYGKEIEKAEAEVAKLKETEAAREAEAKIHALTYARSVGLNLEVGKSASMTAKEIEEQAKSMERAREAAQQLAGSFGGLGDSLNDSEKSFGEWLSEMEASTRALNNFNDNSIKAAKRGLEEGLINSLREAGKEGALRMDQLANGTEDGIRRANSAFRELQAETERTRRVTERLSQVQVKIDTNRAIASISALEAKLRSIKDEDVFVNVRHRTYGSNTLGPVDRSADGSTVPKTGLPYADRHLYLLADGEEIISNRYGQADRHRALLKDINANRLADGGTTGRVGASEGTTRSLERTLKALTRAVEKDTKKRDELRSERNAARDAAMSSFDGGLFGNGLAGLRLQLEADRNDANAMRKSLNAAKKKGLDGGLFAELTASGDLSTAQEVAGMSRAEIRRLERLYAQREQAQRGLGAVAAAPYAGELRDLNKTIKRLNARIDKMESAVERGAKAGTEGKRRRDAQNARTRVR